MRSRRPLFRLRTSFGRGNYADALGSCSAGDALYKNYDRGNSPSVLNLSALTEANRNFRAALWTGENLQITVMEIPVGKDIGLENHGDTEQILVVVSGLGEASMGKDREKPQKIERMGPGYAAVIPKDTWHNVKNVGRTPLKLYSVYSPPHHPYGTLEKESSDQEN